jgi:hypothetical protein
MFIGYGILVLVQKVFIFILYVKGIMGDGEGVV